MSDYSELKGILLERINKQGRITFKDYMASCLYEPGLGYYTSAGRKVGAAGDFYTSITVHAAYGRVIAREIAQMWHCMGTPSDFTLVECGAANGRLACDILDYLAEQETTLYKALTLVLVEKEPTLETAQRQLLAAHISKLKWMTTDCFMAGTAGFTGCIYSNELMDAMPVHRVIMTEKGLREFYVSSCEGELCEETGEPSTGQLTQYLERIGINLFTGQQAEINLAALEWQTAAIKNLHNGFILTIDYGYPAEELYTPRRKLGTLLCYYRHQVEENPYLRPGMQDITSHVDFTSLMKCGEASGLKNIWFGEQYRFMLSAGIVEEIEKIERSDASEEEKLRLRLTLKKLIMPEGGMGDTFRILIQGKNIADAKLLCQRRIGA